MEVVCVQCGKTFERTLWQIKQGISKFCGQACYHASRIGEVGRRRIEPDEARCEVCDKVFLVGGRGRPHKGTRFCSWECRYRGRYRNGAITNELTVPQAAYLAGLIDGEGSVMVLPKWKTVTTRVSVSNTYRGVLDWVKEVTGVGQVYAGRKATSINKQNWNWWCDADTAYSLLKQIRPYMIIKAEQADLALETQERLRQPALKADHTWQEEYRLRMKALNQRGPRAEAIA